MLHIDYNINKLKIQETLFIKFRRPIINRINFQSSNNVLKSLKIDKTICIPNFLQIIPFHLIKTLSLFYIYIYCGLEDIEFKF